MEIRGHGEGALSNFLTISTYKNEKVLHRLKKEWNILHTIKVKSNWIGRILRRNCFLKRVIEGKIEGRIEVTGRRGRRRKQLLDDLKETRGYWKFKRGSSRSHCVENSSCNRLWTCRKTDNKTND
jgi:hypothetical protein